MGGHLIKCLENQKLTPFPEDLSATTVSIVTLSKVNSSTISLIVFKNS